MVDAANHGKLLRLGYSQLWLDSGVLTIDKLDEQIKELDLGEDENIEHYRYRTLTDYFNSQISFNDNTFNLILQLLQSDNDKTMAGSAVVNLVEKSSLTHKQFDKVVDLLKTFGDWTTKQIDKAKQRRIKL